MLEHSHRMPTDDASLLAACRDHGLKATPQRIAILRALRESHGHPGPEQIHAVVTRELPSVSLATVYKTLDALEAHGVIEEVTLKADSKRYDANLTPHHHAVCVRCKGIVDIDDDAVSRALPQIPDGFRVAYARLQILGVCAKCAAGETDHATTSSDASSGDRS